VGLVAARWAVPLNACAYFSFPNLETSMNCLTKKISNSPMYGTVNNDQRAWISMAIGRGNLRSWSTSQSVRGEPAEPRTDDTPMFPGRDRLRIRPKPVNPP